MGTILSLFLVSYYPYVLTLYSGTAQSAMAGADVALAEDAFGLFYNPAGMAYLSNPDLRLELRQILSVISAERWGTALAAPVARALGAGFYATGIYHHYEYTPETTFYHHEFLLGPAVAWRPVPWLGAGLDLKLVGVRAESRGFPLDTTNATGWAVDVGMLARHALPLGTGSVGIAAQHLGPKFHYDGSPNDDLPASLRLGAAYVISARQLLSDDGLALFRRNRWLQRRELLKNWFLDNWRVVVACDLFRILRSSPYTNEPENWWQSLGVEVRPLPFVPIRFGYFTDNSRYPDIGRSGWTMGVGLDFKYVRLDLTDANALFYPSNVFPFAGKRLTYALGFNFTDPILPAGWSLDKWILGGER